MYRLETLTVRKTQAAPKLCRKKYQKAQKKSQKSGDARKMRRSGVR